MNQKVWETPQLMVLVRSNPEEVVLQGCKQAQIEGPNSPATPLTACAAGDDPCQQNQGS